MQRNLPVLIAEDNEDDAFLLSRALRSTGVEAPVQIVTEGEQVTFRDRQQLPFPGVVFLDIKMTARPRPQSRRSRLVLKKGWHFWLVCARSK